MTSEFIKAFSGFLRELRNGIRENSNEKLETYLENIGGNGRYSKDIVCPDGGIAFSSFVWNANRRIRFGRK